ncbi:MAG TPA: hypothetical protein VLJ86_26560 [Ramlibacter sp.]|nr:hypothetical protein [Ramlibacter sp.]
MSRPVALQQTKDMLAECVAAIEKATFVPEGEARNQLLRNLRGHERSLSAELGLTLPAAPAST